ncbi:SMP-30/gluconolactonase/LRE family protein [Alcaligenes aquatilis]|uniref:SMP-30/gluconolactonase/LRE family protein n=1 Tax=Alcaligenes aquatilis TaxID=323284 RepID=UPI003F9339B2
MPHDYHLRQIAPAQAELGESPVWDALNGLLYFVDITQGQIKALTPQARLSTVYQSTARIGALALSDHGNLVFTENSRVCMLDTKTGTISSHSPAVKEATSYRFNDGACDPQGRFVTGLMDEARSGKTGALYRYGGELQAQQIHAGMSLPNGLTWSVDGKTLFFVDSVACSIFAADYSWANDELTTVSLFAQTPVELGRPDGIALDQAGGLWVCQFNGVCLLHYDNKGQLIDRVAMPVPRPTSCCFGGPDLDTLFITTARFAMTAAELERYPQAGNVYAIHPKVGGLARHLFKEVATELD